MKFEFSAKLGAYIERAQIINLELSEKKMFKDSFNFLLQIFKGKDISERPGLLKQDFSKITLKLIFHTSGFYKHSVLRGFTLVFH